MKLLCGQSNRVWHYAAGRWPGSVGLLVGPSYFDKVPIDPWMDFALDNDAFTSWSHKKPWSVAEWLHMISKVRLLNRKPLWAAVPDSVGNAKETLALWHMRWRIISNLGWHLAFCVQDGMVPKDVPTQAEIIFVGGTDGWKFKNLPIWTERFPRVHCARVNSPQMFERCEELGCESIDGTGWFRDPSRKDKLPAILRFLEGWRENHPELALTDLDPI